MRNIFESRRKNETTFQYTINVGPQVNVHDVEDLTVKNKYACCDCSKESSLVGILTGTFGFVTGWIQNILLAGTPKVIIVKLIVLSVLLASVGGAITLSLSLSLSDC